MEISLSNFSYFFRLTGNSGGLVSMELEFKPYLYEGQEVYDIKAVARGCIDSYNEIFDPLYNAVIDGKKEPQLTDTPHLVRTSYRYTGCFTRRRLRALEKLLRAMFGEETVEPRGDISVHEPQEVTLMYSFYKGDNGLSDVTVKVSFNMSHVLNVCLFRFTQQLGVISTEKNRLCLYGTT